MIKQWIIDNKNKNILSIKWSFFCTKHNKHFFTLAIHYCITNEIINNCQLL